MLVTMLWSVIVIGLLLSFLNVYWELEDLKRSVGRLQHGYFETSDAIDDLYARVTCDEDICDDCMADFEAFIQDKLPELPVTPKKKSVKKVVKKTLTKKSK